MSSHESGTSAKKPLKWWITCLSCVMLATVIAMVFSIKRLRDSGLKYDDKTLAEWLVELHPSNSDERQLRARSAIRSIGTNALPFLLDRIAYTERKPEKVLRSLLSRFGSRYESREFEVRLQAIGGFEALGPIASPAIPELERLLFEKSVPECASALGAIGSETIPILVKALTNSNAKIRAEAASSVSFLGADAEPLTPTLIQLTRDKDQAVRIGAILGLKVGRSSGSTVPRLIELLQDPDELIRKLSAEVLGEIGEKATSALPALEKATLDPSNYVIKHAQIAIQRIRSAASVSTTKD